MRPSCDVDAQAAVVAAEHADGGEVVASSGSGCGSRIDGSVAHRGSSVQRREPGPVPSCRAPSPARRIARRRGAGVVAWPQPRCTSSIGGPVFAGHPAVAPAGERDDDAVEVAPLLGETVLEARRALLVAHAPEHAVARRAWPADRPGDGASCRGSSGSPRIAGRRGRRRAGRAASSGRRSPTACARSSSRASRRPASARGH